MVRIRLASAWKRDPALREALAAGGDVHEVAGRLEDALALEVDGVDVCGGRAEGLLVPSVLAVGEALLALLAGGPLTYASWKALFTKGPMPFIALLFAVSALIHAWIGMRDILMDYIKPVALRLALEVFVILWLVGCAGWAVRILWRL